MVDTDLQHSLRDVEDHVERLISRADSFRDLLQNALTLDGTLTANRQNEASAEQNEQVKKISSWAAIFFAPSFVGCVRRHEIRQHAELPDACGHLAHRHDGGTALMYTISTKGLASSPLA